MLFHKYIVLGSGKTGLETVIQLAQKGHDVLLVEENDIGGSYLFSNDLPKEFIGKQANSIHTLRKRLPMEIQKSLTIDIEKIVSSRIKNRYQKIQNQLKKYPNLNIIQGHASFGAGNIIEVVKNEERVLVAFEQCIVCVGLGQMEIPNITGLNKTPFKYQHSAFYGDNVPGSLCIIGCHQSNLEVADIYSSLGVRVTIFEQKPPEEILENHDTTTINYLLQNLLRKGVEFFFEAKVTKVEEKDKNVAVTDHENTVYNFSTLYINVKEYFKDSLKLTNIGLKFSHNGIYTSSAGLTNQKSIYAFGACSSSFGINSTVSQIMQYVERQEPPKTNNDVDLSRTVTVVENSSKKLADLANLNFWHSKINLEKPVCTVGLSFKEAIGKHGSYSKFVILLNDDIEGFVKLIYNDQNNELLGFAAVGECCNQTYFLGIDAIDKKLSIIELKSLLVALNFNN